MAKEEFLLVLEKHKAIIYKICNAYCPAPEHRDDLVQEVIMQLWKAYPKYNPEYKLSTWIYRITLNVAISHYRKEKTRTRHVAPLDHDSVYLPAPEENEDIKVLNKFISELDELNKALILLYLDGNSHKEIALILNISESNVGTKISRIKKLLKRKFDTLN